jgi:alanine dehydrogenase
MPGAVARTSTFALNNATLPFILALADKGPTAAMLADPHLLAGLNVHKGRIAPPPRRVQGGAFDAGGGERSVQAEGSV